MASKFIALFALVAVASAQHYNNDYYQSNNYANQYDDHHYSAPAVIKQIQPAIVKTIQPALIKSVQPLVKHIEHEEPANYEFKYDVHDHHTGDIKQQHEVAHNGAIQGEYSLIDADGYRRVVSYTADDHHGFQANVRREPLEGHKIVAHQPTVAKIVAPVTKIVASAPQQHYAQQYSAPQQHYTQQYSAPVQHYSAPKQQYAQQYSAPQQNYAQQYSAPQQHYTQQYSAPVQHKYVAPLQYATPVVQKYVAAPVQHQYVTPVQKVAYPVVQKYIQPAPVVEKYVAPVAKYSVTPLKAVVAQPIKYTSAEHTAHVSVNAPHFNYQY